MLMGWKNINIKMSILLKAIYRFCDPYQNSNGIFHRTRTNNSKMYMEPYKHKKSQTAKEILRNKKAGGITVWFQSTLQSYSNQNSMSQKKTCKTN